MIWFFGQYRGFSWPGSVSTSEKYLCIAYSMSDMGDGSTRLRNAIGDAAFLRVASARRAAWEGGAFGLFSGVCIGFGVARLVEQKRNSAHQHMSPDRAGKRNAPSALEISRGKRNRAAVAAMLCGAAFSFLGSIAGGTPAINSLGDVWENIAPRKSNLRALEALDAVRESEADERAALIQRLQQRAAARSRANEGAVLDGADEGV